MAIGTQGSIGKAGMTRSGPKIGKSGKKTGPIGKAGSKIHGSALSLDQGKTKVGYPTTTTTV